MIIQEIMTAKRELEQLLNKKKNVHSIGVKITPTESFLVVFVKKVTKTFSKEIPNQIQNFPVKIEVL